MAVALFMPSRPEVSRLLSEDERTLRLTRLDPKQSIEAFQGVDREGPGRSLTDRKTYVVSISYSHQSSVPWAWRSRSQLRCTGMNMSLAPVGGSWLSIVERLGGTQGYKNTQPQL